MSKTIKIYNKSLDPNLWGENLKLNPEIRNHLIKIGTDFYKNTELQAPVEDMYLLGSSANYNWTPNSDIDLHIIIDIIHLKMNETYAKKFLKSLTTRWNMEHDVVIKGHKVEIYIQDLNEKNRSTGVYSLMHDDWIKRPCPEHVEVDQNLIQNKYDLWVSKINDAVNQENPEKMKALMDALVQFREVGLGGKGELSTENLVFKILRSRGMIDKLKTAMNKVYDRELSVKEINENITDDYIGGIFQGEVRGIKLSPGTARLRTHNEFEGLYSGQNSTNWRYDSKKNLVLWNTQPENHSIDLVNDWLARKGVVSPKHKNIYNYLEEGNELDDIIQETVDEVINKLNEDDEEVPKKLPWVGISSNSIGGEYAQAARFAKDDFRNYFIYLISPKSKGGKDLGKNEALQKIADLMRQRGYNEDEIKQNTILLSFIPSRLTVDEDDKIPKSKLIIPGMTSQHSGDPSYRDIGPIIKMNVPITGKDLGRYKKWLLTLSITDEEKIEKYEKVLLTIPPEESELDIPYLFSRFLNHFTFRLKNSFDIATLREKISDNFKNKYNKKWKIEENSEEEEGEYYSLPWIGFAGSSNLSGSEGRHENPGALIKDDDFDRYYHWLILSVEKGGKGLSPSDAIAIVNKLKKERGLYENEDEEEEYKNVQWMGIDKSTPGGHHKAGEFVTDDFVRYYNYLIAPKEKGGKGLNAYEAMLIITRLKKERGLDEVNINETPQISRKGRNVYAGDSKLKKLKVEDIKGNIVVFRQPDDSGFFREGSTWVYFMDNEESAQKLKRNEIPMIIVPRGTIHHGGSPITDIWKAKFQKPGTEHILGVLEGFTDENLIYVEMLTVRRGYKRNRIASLMLDLLKKLNPNAELKYSTPTENGRDFIDSYLSKKKLDEIINGTINEVLINIELDEISSNIPPNQKRLSLDEGIFYNVLNHWMQNTITKEEQLFIGYFVEKYKKIPDTLLQILSDEEQSKAKLLVHNALKGTDAVVERHDPVIYIRQLRGMSMKKSLENLVQRILKGRELLIIGRFLQKYRANYFTGEEKIFMDYFRRITLDFIEEMNKFYNTGEQPVFHSYKPEKN